MLGGEVDFCVPSFADRHESAKNTKVDQNYVARSWGRESKNKAKGRQPL